MHEKWINLRDRISGSCRDIQARFSTGKVPGKYPSDLHIHTNYSDGKDEMELMIRTAAMNQLETISITDHLRGHEFPSGKSIQSYLDEVERHAADYPEMTVLKGAEGTLTNPQGEITAPEEELEKFDILLVDLGYFDYGVHDGGDSEFLRNIRSCMVSLCENPAVDIMAHPLNMGRLKDGFSFDWLPESMMREIAACFKETKTCFELMNDIWWWFPQMSPQDFIRDYANLVRIFDEAGVKFTIGSDSHHHQGVGGTGFVRALVNQVLS